MVRPPSPRWRRRSVPPQPPFPGRSRERSGRSFEDERVRAGVRPPAAERLASRRDWRRAKLCLRSWSLTSGRFAAARTVRQQAYSVSVRMGPIPLEAGKSQRSARGRPSRTERAADDSHTVRGPVLLSVGGNTDLSDHNIRIKRADQELCDQEVCGLHHPAWTPLAPDGTGECPGFRALSVTPAPAALYAMWPVFIRSRLPNPQILS